MRIPYRACLVSIRLKSRARSARKSPLGRRRSRTAGLPVVRTDRRQRARRAGRLRALAHYLAVELQKFVGLPEFFEMGANLLLDRAASAVHARVGFLLFDETEPRQHTQRVGVRRQKRLHAGIQKNLLGSRLADSRKYGQRFFFATHP